ncbi:MAG: purine-binding chemotaxis protein CheW [Deltaproteobacteria bacterium]|nr:purine-binding chemotaxis protein CheW [Deltaproteobacteria bacterium]
MVEKISKRKPAKKAKATKSAKKAKSAKSVKARPSRQKTPVTPPSDEDPPKAALSAQSEETAKPRQGFVDSLDAFFLRPEEGGFDGGLAVRRSSQAEEREYLSFRLADEIFAVSIDFIREIMKPPVSTPMPRTEPVILGVFSLRGDILPLVDFRILLRVDESPVTRKSRVLVVKLSDESVGLLVDEVMNVLRFAEDDIEPPPAVFGRMEAEHLVGVGRFEGVMITLIDLEEVVRLDPFVCK